MSHLAIHVRKHLTPSNQNKQRLTLACTCYNAYCCICMCEPVCYDFLLFSFTDVVCSVGIIISVFSTSIKPRAMGIGSRTIYSFCHASGIVELNVICLAFYVEENISALVTGYCKSNRRGLWEEIL